MSEVQDYNSRLSDPNSRKFETLSYLPPLTEEQVRAEVEYIVAKGWNPAIEHTEPENAAGSYWYMWKLPMFGETDVDTILAEADAFAVASCEEALELRESGIDNPILLLEGPFEPGVERWW